MRGMALVFLVVLCGLGGAVADPTEIPSFYVGFEDREARDYDYNDFGMTMTIVESRDDRQRIDALEIQLEARVHLAGDVHDVHLARRFTPGTRYAYTLDRTRPAEGSESVALRGPVQGAGDLDVVVFDSAFAVPGDLVRITIELEEPLAERPYSDADSPYDPNGFFAGYDPWIFDRDVAVERHLRDAQWFRGSDLAVPYVLMLPAANWAPPAENMPVTEVYPDFTEYFATGDRALARWFDPEEPG